MAGKNKCQCGNRYDFEDYQPKRLPQCGHVLCITCCLAKFTSENKVICPECKGISQRNPGLYPLDKDVEALILEKQGICTKVGHGQNKEFYCQEDRMLLCGVCSEDGSHEAHSIRNKNEVEAEMKENQVPDLIYKLQVLLEKTEAKLEFYDEEVSKITAMASQVHDQIEDRTDEIILLILRKKREQLEFLSQKTDSILTDFKERAAAFSALRDSILKRLTSEHEELQGMIKLISKSSVVLADQSVDSDVEEKHHFQCLKQEQFSEELWLKFVDLEWTKDGIVQSFIEKVAQQNEAGVESQELREEENSNAAQQLAEEAKEEEEKQQIEQSVGSHHDANFLYRTVSFNSDRQVTWNLATTTQSKTQLPKKLSLSYTYVSMIEQEGFLLTGGPKEDEEQRQQLVIVRNQLLTENKMITPRYFHGVEYTHGIAYITGGSNQYSSWNSDCEMFNMQTGECKSLPSLPVGLYGHGTSMDQTSMFIFGGNIGHEKNSSSIYRFSGEQWSNMPHKLTQPAEYVKGVHIPGIKASLIYSNDTQLKNSQLYDYSSVIMKGDDFPHDGGFQHYNGMEYLGKVFNIHKMSDRLWVFDLNTDKWLEL